MPDAPVGASISLKSLDQRQFQTGIFTRADLQGSATSGPI
jgi:hypothetical protein